MNNRIQYWEPSAPATDEQIARFESNLGIQLPQDYRTFLQQTNGGHPEPCAFSLLNDPRDTHALIAWFFALDDQRNTNDLLRKVKSYREDIPAELMPIAIDPGGSIICLAISGDNRGTVYFWDQDDVYPPGQAPDYHNIYFVAHSFDELLNSLSDLPDE